MVVIFVFVMVAVGMALAVASFVIGGALMMYAGLAGLVLVTVWNILGSLNKKPAVSAPA
jgi:lipopolysaccharide export LptBFGC system permease protein LptF